MPGGMLPTRLVAGRHPLKQGLKLSDDIRTDQHDIHVAGRHPLKQGLKHGAIYGRTQLYEAKVAGRHPLKQGLKLIDVAMALIKGDWSQGGIH